MMSGMGQYQLGKRLNDDEIASIVTFLRTLTGTNPAICIQPPQLPKSTTKTPKPSNACLQPMIVACC